MTQQPIGFDSEKYLELQSEHIKERISSFEKLYLEFGGKLFDDYHASRVLPGFAPDNKIKMLEHLKDEVEIIIAVSADAIEENKLRGDLGITYDAEVLRIGVYCIRVQSALLFAHAMNSIIKMFYAGIGKAKWALLMSTARQGYLFIPLVFILPPLFGTYGVASVQAAADLISLAISIPLMLKAYKMIKEAAEVG